MYGRALRILGAFGGLALAAAGIAIWTVDLDRFIAPIRSQVQAATGRDLEIRGRIGWALFPEPAIVLSDVSVANAPWARAPALATARRVEAQIALLPLLARRLEFARLDVFEPTIALETDAHGRGNWEATGATPPEIASASGAIDSASPSVLGELALRRGTVTFDGGRSDTPVRATIDVITLRARDAASPIDVDFRGTVGDAAVAVAGRLGPYETLRARQWPYPIDLSGNVAGRKGAITAKFRADGATYSLDELIVAYASNSFKGKVSVTAGGERPKLSIYASTRSIRVDDLPWFAGAPAVAVPATVPSRLLIPVTPLPLDALGAFDIDFKLEAGAIFLRQGWQLNRVDAKFVVQDGRLDTKEFTANVFGGSLAARLAIDDSRDADPSVALRIDARNVDLAALLRAAGVQREVHDAKAALAADLTGRGRSLHAWASSANGNALLNVGSGSLGRNPSAPAGAFDQIVDALVPLGAEESSTELLCAAARIPLAGGVARFDRSLAVATAKVGANASGMLDFGAESIDLVFHAQARHGNPTGLPKVARFVRLEGPLADPKVTIGAGAAVPNAIRSGAAIGGTMGAWPLRKPGVGGKAGPCAVALDRAGDWRS